MNFYGKNFIHFANVSKHPVVFPEFPLNICRISLNVQANFYEVAFTMVEEATEKHLMFLGALNPQLRQNTGQLLYPLSYKTC